MSLKQLHMQFCNITAEGGASIGDLLANTKSALELLNLAGNRLTGVGLSQICRGLMTNTRLETLSLSDNMIDQNPEDMVGISDFRDCLNQPNLMLTSVDLMFNRIGEQGALILAQALTPENKKITEFLVDITIPLPLFEKICRKGGGKKGKKGKKKK
jgi:Ran GTPase-activating protein (RanGAP) involved in mRNA processing and transport